MPRQEAFKFLHFIGAAPHYVAINAAMNVDVAEAGHDSAIAKINSSLIWRGLRFVP